MPNDWKEFGYRTRRKGNQKLTNSRGDPPQKMQQLVIPICNCPFITIPMIVEKANLFIYTIHGCYGKYFDIFCQVFCNRSCVVKVVISVELFWCVADATRSWCTRSGSPIQRVRATRKQTLGQLTKEPNVLRFEKLFLKSYGYSHYVEENLNLFRRLQAI